MRRRQDVVCPRLPYRHCKVAGGHDAAVARDLRLSAATCRHYLLFFLHQTIFFAPNDARGLVWIYRRGPEHLHWPMRRATGTDQKKSFS